MEFNLDWTQTKLSAGSLVRSESVRCNLRETDLGRRVRGEVRPRQCEERGSGSWCGICGGVVPGRWWTELDAVWGSGEVERGARGWGGVRERGCAAFCGRRATVVVDLRSERHTETESESVCAHLRLSLSSASLSTFYFFLLLFPLLPSVYFLLSGLLFPLSSTMFLPI
ncbi:hypothetical protein KC19_9G115700 [Ceratodon purpureus]|uniref:Uncharacterized protein n=1 Tax=Ceratodon purpureus TaxID=3225 RepID=A0A8T0GR11_CERPU|nr:hypothetical protein KC19_9G115700 [Ceratodon purpureus]